VATTTRISAPPRTSSVLALWHLLSLDAPTVAALWTCFIARATHTTIPAALPVAMFLMVWLLYATDRLLDARDLDGRVPHNRYMRSSEHRHHQPEFELRHLFHFRHRRVFLAIMPAAGLGIAALLPDLLPATLHLYLLEGALLLAWFLLVHTTRSRLPKELVVGLYFAAATFTPTLIRRPPAPYSLLLQALLFAALCTLNCLFIHAWQSNIFSAQRGLITAAQVLCLVSIASALTGPAPALPIACALSHVALLVLHRLRSSVSRTHLRAAADFALLTPVLLLPFLR